ncbi:saccharopine dehydrogenase NADP-binding domain-containing protein [Nocardiopsis tropica]|nr:saccharopine dehydrogenase NADP-binding domain-containing protein [Nocardiopsis tropica]
MGSGFAVAVVGASGHTGRFVAAELRRRGHTPVLVGRDAGRLRDLRASHPGSPARAASMDDPASLDGALEGADAVVNCAGPFAVTAAPVVGAALRAGVPYVDVAAEIEANRDTFTHFEQDAREAGVAVVPAMAFFGGLGDLLATAAAGGWGGADEVHVAYGLSGWAPTEGTRAAGRVSRQRRDGRRVVFANGRLEYRDGAPPAAEWAFPEPMGTRAVVGEFTMAEVTTIPRHLDVREVHTYMTVEAATGLSAPAARTPAGADGPDRPAETFLVDVLVRSGGAERRAFATGRDIYAVSAPLAVEAVERILTGRTGAAGVASAGEMFDAADFLRALSPHVATGPLHGERAPGAEPPAAAP